MDLILGTFADANVSLLDVPELDLYEELLNIPDPDVYDWISRQKPVPANVMNPVIEKLLAHDYARHRSRQEN